MSTLSRIGWAAIAATMIQQANDNPWRGQYDRRPQKPRDTHLTPSPKRAKVKAARKQRRKQK